MAQLVEQRIRNAWVAGSSPAGGSKVSEEGVLVFKRTPSCFFEAMQKLFPIADDFYNILKETQRGKIALNKTLVGYGKHKRVAKDIRLYNIFGE